MNKFDKIIEIMVITICIAVLFAGVYVAFDSRVYMNNLIEQQENATK